MGRRRADQRTRRPKPEAPRSTGTRSAAKSSAQDPAHDAALRLQDAAGNRVASELISRNPLVTLQSTGPTIRRDWAEEMKKRADQMRDFHTQAMTHRVHHLSRPREQLAATIAETVNATDLEEYVVGRVVEFMKENLTGPVDHAIRTRIGATTVPGAVPEAVDATMQQQREEHARAQQTAAQEYLALRLEALEKADREDLEWRVRNKLLFSAAELGVAEATKQSTALQAALDEARLKQKDLVLKLQLATYGHRRLSEIDTREESLNTLLSRNDFETFDTVARNQEAEVAESSFLQMQQDIVDEVKTDAKSRIEGLRDGIVESLTGSRGIDRRRLVSQAASHAVGLVQTEGKRENLAQQAVKQVVEGDVNSGLAKLAPVLEILAGEVDTTAQIGLKIKVPVITQPTEVFVQLDFSIKAAKKESAISADVELGISAGGDLAKLLKGTIGFGGYLSAEAPDATTLLNSISLAFYRRFKDSGFPYADSMWSLGGVTRKDRESKDAAKTREAQAFAAMVEEQMGEEGAVETGGFVGGGLEVGTTGLKGGVEMRGTKGTKLNKRAFATKQRKAGTAGFEFKLKGTVGPFSGSVAANIGTETYESPSGIKNVVNLGGISVSVGGEWPNAAIYGDPAQMAAIIATWIAQLKPLVDKVRRVVSEKTAKGGDALAALSALSNLKDQIDAARSGVEGTWAAKHATFGTAPKSALVGTSGLKLGLKYGMTDDKGKGTVYLDLLSTTGLDFDVVGVEYKSTQRLWKHQWDS